MYRHRIPKRPHRPRHNKFWDQSVPHKFLWSCLSNGGVTSDSKLVLKAGWVGGYLEYVVMKQYKHFSVALCSIIPHNPYEIRSQMEISNLAYISCLRMLCPAQYMMLVSSVPSFSHVDPYTSVVLHALSLQSNILEAVRTLVNSIAVVSEATFDNGAVTTLTLYIHGGMRKRKIRAKEIEKNVSCCAELSWLEMYIEALEYSDSEMFKAFIDQAQLKCRQRCPCATTPTRALTLLGSLVYGAHLFVDTAKPGDVNFECSLQPFRIPEGTTADESNIPIALRNVIIPEVFRTHLITRDDESQMDEQYVVDQLKGIGVVVGVEEGFLSGVTLRCVTFKSSDGTVLARWYGTDRFQTLLCASYSVIERYYHQATIQLPDVVKALASSSEISTLSVLRDCYKHEESFSTLPDGLTNSVVVLRVDDNQNYKCEASLPRLRLLLEVYKSVYVNHNPVIQALSTRHMEPVEATTTLEPLCRALMKFEYGAAYECTVECTKNNTVWCAKAEVSPSQTYLADVCANDSEQVEHVLNYALIMNMIPSVAHLVPTELRCVFDGFTFMPSTRSRSSVLSECRELAQQALGPLYEFNYTSGAENIVTLTDKLGKVVGESRRPSKVDALQSAYITLTRNLLKSSEYATIQARTHIKLLAREKDTFETYIARFEQAFLSEMGLRIVERTTFSPEKGMYTTVVHGVGDTLTIFLSTSSSVSKQHAIETALSAAATVHMPLYAESTLSYFSHTLQEAIDTRTWDPVKGNVRRNVDLHLPSPIVSCSRDNLLRIAEQRYQSHASIQMLPNASIFTCGGIKITETGSSTIATFLSLMDSLLQDSEMNQMYLARHFLRFLGSTSYLWCVRHVLMYHLGLDLVVETTKGPDMMWIITLIARGGNSDFILSSGRSKVWEKGALRAAQACLQTHFPKIRTPVPYNYEKSTNPKSLWNLPCRLPREPSIIAFPKLLKDTCVLGLMRNAVQDAYGEVEERVEKHPTLLSFVSVSIWNSQKKEVLCSHHSPSALLSLMECYSVLIRNNKVCLKAFEESESRFPYQFSSINPLNVLETVLKYEFGMDLKITTFPTIAGYEGDDENAKKTYCWNTQFEAYYDDTPDSSVKLGEGEHESERVCTREVAKHVLRNHFPVYYSKHAQTFNATGVVHGGEEKTTNSV
eukprot:PhF_6_TR37568/c0_g1_i1/m.55672